MTTFTTEDRIFSAQDPWPNPWADAKNYRQAEIEFFFPLTEQIPLNLDYTDCAKPKLTLSTGPYTFNTGLSWSTTTPQLTVHSTNSVGQLNIGGISVALEKQPKWYQRLLFKLLGFNWKDR
jgi:hypothetical protein